MGAKLSTLTNLVSANNKKFESGLKRITGVAHSWKRVAAKERALMKENLNAMNRDLTKSIARAIQIGEARAKAVEDRAKSNIAKVAGGLQTLASEKIEAMANKVFKTVQGGRQKIADNYLSLKAYSATAADKITDYVAKGKGRGLGAIGDLLKTVGSRAHVKAGILEVDRVGGKAGNFVFVNAHSVGLSSKLSDFEKLGVRMTHYQKTLAKMTGKLAQKHKKMTKQVYVKPPEWEGN